jgi:hypothetical protein
MSTCIAAEEQARLLTAVSPGEILLEEFLKPLELSANALALVLRPGCRPAPSSRSVRRLR